MNQSHYQQAKQQLEEIAQQIKAEHPNDKPLQRMVINDAADNLSREFWRHTNDKKAEQWKGWIASYAARLHDKNS